MKSWKKLASVGRKRIKGRPLLIKLHKDLRSYLDLTAERENRTKVAVIEDLLRFRQQFKTWPPYGGRA